ncbi:prolipoprotein diacylglyceryl transferase [Fulvivirgaceae bacterium BMA10]|uniref:Phosphatidylglycerol--prolipoprotein diacylglyceryl transferase n=1 Tax=Splendidivirga corallicola TaxID=3051826 RepID=A0ABT8KGV7_9BACT|nr:prolipoprotein diacylglyceryl transferase [Fulvivirgaceae bacterium BMA10]
MHPVLFTIDVPDGLRFFLPSEITIYTYGTLIALGGILASIYTAIRAKKELDIPYHTTNNLALVILLASVVGGKLFFYFEKPSYYFGTLSNMWNDPGNGFVFYGSLIFAIGSILIFFKINKIPALKMLDIIAFTTGIVHIFGRLGCFNAGCCHGLPHEGFLSVIFTDPACQARPLNVGLHPTQLYSAAMIFLILIILTVLKKYQRFEGQIFLGYVGLYAIGRSIVEEFRGDYARGFLFDDFLSHSQFISLILLIITVYFYYKLNKRALPKK